MDGDSGGPSEPCIIWGAYPPREGAIFAGCPDHSKALAMFAAVVAATLAAPITIKR